MTQSGTKSESPPAGKVTRLAAHLFREEAGKLVSVLTRIFGIRHLQLAEDVVQEALARALQVWPYYGIPDNPAAWLTQTAKNLALDVLRREIQFRKKETDIALALEQWSQHASDGDAPLLHTEIRDARLRLLFACCHPQIPPESQSALALKTLCGFGVAEIASAFLTTPAAIAKRLTRARNRIQEEAIPFIIPAGDELSERLDGVLKTLYLLFSEGYKASVGDNLLRGELCAEAIRLVGHLVEHPALDQPRAHALLALMLLNGARLPARIDQEGNLLRLQEQDRSAWNRPMIIRGLLHLGRSAAGDEISKYHIEAGIAACHSTAPDYHSTDWSRILFLYDQLLPIENSPIVALNRAVAVGHALGPCAGIEALDSMQDQELLEAYYLLYAVRAEFEIQLGQFQPAAVQLRKALQLTTIASERLFLSNRLRECETKAGIAREAKPASGFGAPDS